MRPTVTLLAVFLVSALAAGCASQGSQPATEAANGGSLSANVGTAATGAATQTRDGFSGAATAPLDDLNLRRREIPPLLAGMPSPYHLPPDLTCARIEMDIAELDAVLGLDWDSGEPDRRLNTEILADEAADAALDAVRDVSTGWIPFRGLLRRATGAESHEKRYNQAFRIGAQRRAYLKGYGLALGCDVPARPDFERLREGDADSRILYR
ncbi:hypothetical protein [Hyphomonas sp.]|uniref:hypothetical protein n=1 Tax=Hyphomonas sp. TaxID=87 RepID=UPI00391D5E7E